LREKKPRPKITLGKLYRGARPPEKSYYKLFEQLAEMYANFRERIDSGPVTTYNPDPIAPFPLRPDLAVCWLVDTENAISAACRDDKAMQNCALGLLRTAAGLPVEPVSEGLKYKTIQAIGRTCERRGIWPTQKYFTTQKRRKEK